MIRLALLVLLALWAPQPVRAAPAAELWARWAQHDPSSTMRVDHRLWARFLAAYVRPGEHGLNRVAYGSVTAEGRADLTAYLAMLTAVPVSTLNRREQMAFWINLYNALTVRVVLDHYPVASIRDIDISPGLFSNGPWRAKLIAVEGEPLSLDDIEHRILRPIWRDPRIHYAVNCASVGCPNLQAEPFAAADLDRALDHSGDRLRQQPARRAAGCRRPVGVQHLCLVRGGFRRRRGRRDPASDGLRQPQDSPCACKSWTESPAMATTGH